MLKEFGMVKHIESSRHPGGQLPIVLVMLLGIVARGMADEKRVVEKPDRESSVDLAERHFAVRVLPLLKRKCLGCHGGESKTLRGNFDVRSRVALLRGGESKTAALVPGKPEKSPLLSAIRWDGLEMPPKKNDRLSAEQVKWVRDWIQAGAPWPDEKTIARYREQEYGAVRTAEGILISTSGGLSDEWTYRRYKPENTWAFQPVSKPVVPDSAPHPIDAFIRARLSAAAITPANLADPLTLIRRASYDLTGLPPTPGQVDAFSAAWETGPEMAWSRLIDRLLASPQYGERWGQHWLDVARYADSSGYSNDWERSNAWRYRDYVIRSFNNDKPYDQFIVEQLAGDEWKPNDAEMRVAVGFLRMGPWEHTGMSPNKVSRQIFLDDMVNSIGQTFLSTALRCCRCHDHKFDPIPTRDYYRFYAALATTQPAERPVAFLSSEKTSDFRENRKHVEALLQFATDQLAILTGKREAAARKWYAERGRENEYVPFNRRRKIRDKEKPKRFVGLTTAEQGMLKIREQDVRIWKRRLERFLPMVQGVYSGGDLYQQSVSLRLPDPKKKWEITRSQKLPESTIYAVGSVFASTESVTPGVLSGLQLAVASASKEDPYALPRGIDGRRLALARWIADPKNPLTTRSIVNRIWQHHFGRGLAGNPNNLGMTGGKPTHPKLLDWLSAELVDRGWSLKSMHRLLMTSRTYQQASRHEAIEAIRKQDPDNDLLASFRPRRLTAEELRDAMLAVSGELNLDGGGLPISPEINMEVALAPRMLQSSLAPAWQPSRTPRERNRRSIYVYRLRGLADPFLEVFNKPGANVSCERRDAPSVTPQVFSLMNSDVVTSRSIAMAVRLERERPSTAKRIRRGFRLALGETPGPQMMQRLLQHYEAMVVYHRAHQPRPPGYPTRVTRSVVEELSGDPFEYQELLDIYQDYVPDRQASDVGAETRALADICLLLFNSNAFIYLY